MGDTTLTPEILYSFRLVGAMMHIYKWVDGSKDCVDHVSITQSGKGSCDCFGSMRAKVGEGCKHIKMMRKLRALEIPLMGSFYDYDRDLLYTPEDNEGIPLFINQGALIDIGLEALMQGKAY